MSNPHPNDQNAEQLELIVSYLDGELSPEESAQVEQRLAADENFRRELQGVDRAWGALDELPQITVDDNFGRTTMEMVVQSAGDDVRKMTMAMPVQRRKRRLATAMLAVGALLAGMLVARLVWPDVNQQLALDLPVIQYIDIYSQFRDVEFLRRLKSIRGMEALIAKEQTEAEISQWQQIVSDDTREEWLDTLEDEHRIELRAKFNRFQTLSLSQQERLRALHAEIASAPDADRLQETMLTYQHWLNGLPASEQFELRELEINDRLRRISQMIEQQSKERLLTLTEEELVTLYHELRPQLEAIRARVLRDRAEDEQSGRRKRSSRERFWEFLSRRNLEQAMELMDTIRRVLPEDKAEAFMRLSLPQKRIQLMAWMREASWLTTEGRRPGPGKGGKGISDQELERFFVEEVDAATKETLLALPQDKMERQLRRMYEGSLPMRGFESSPEDQWRDDGPRGDRPRGERWAPPPPRGEQRPRPEERRSRRFDSEDNDDRPRRRRPESFDGPPPSPEPPP